MSELPSDFFERSLHEVDPEVAEAMVTLAMIRLMLRRLGPSR